MDIAVYRMFFTLSNPFRIETDKSAVDVAMFHIGFLFWVTTQVSNVISTMSRIVFFPYGLTTIQKHKISILAMSWIIFYSFSGAVYKHQFSVVLIFTYQNNILF